MGIEPVETERTVLRLLTSGDSAAVHAILGDERTTANVSFGQPDLDGTRSWLARRLTQQQRCGVSMWAAELRTTGDLIALCGFFPVDADEVELGYVVRADHWRQGLATELAAAAVSAARGAGYRVTATIRSTNTWSLRVARHVGLTQTGRTDDTRGQLLVFST